MAPDRCERIANPLLPRAQYRYAATGLVAMPPRADSFCSLRVLSILTPKDARSRKDMAVARADTGQGIR